MSAASIKALREIAMRPKVEEGTTVRFRVRYQASFREYSYVAILLGGFWYTTAQSESLLEEGAMIAPKMSQFAFSRVLSSLEVVATEVATAWETL